MLHFEQRVGICKSHPLQESTYVKRQCRSSHVEFPAHDIQFRPTPVTKASVYYARVFSTIPLRRAQPTCQDQIDQLDQDIAQQVR